MFFSRLPHFNSKLSLRSTRPALALLGIYLLLAACATLTSTPTPTLPIALTATATFSPSPQPSATVSPTYAGTPIAKSNAVWENFATPALTPVTPIPPPLTGITIPEEVRILALAGVDRPLPFSGRTDAIALVIYHPRLARASVVSVPPDLFGYIPGYTMQRMNTAYTVGGVKMLSDALEYNLGIKPDEYVVFNLNSFSQLIDDLGGINVPVLENIRQYCPSIPPGVIYMNGEQALCYMRLRLGEDEATRNRRQQELMRTVFLRLVEGGNLVRIPELYEQYRTSIDSNLTLDQMLNSVPLALKLGDPRRIGYFQMSENELKVWEISRQPEARVFLSQRPELMRFMQDAINYVTTPSPLSEIVVTLEYELTISPTPTSTFTVTPTASRTPTPFDTPTTGPATTATLTPTITRTPTRTFTPGPSPTSSNTPTRTPTRTKRP